MTETVLLCGGVMLCRNIHTRTQKTEIYPAISPQGTVTRRKSKLDAGELVWTDEEALERASSFTNTVLKEG